MDVQAATEERPRLVAEACSAAPAGHARWTLRLLAGRVVEKQLAETISHETVRQVLKKTKVYGGPLRQDTKVGSAKVRFTFLWDRETLYIGRRRGCGNVGNGTFRCPHFHSRCYTATGWRYTVAGVW